MDGRLTYPQCLRCRQGAAVARDRQEMPQVIPIKHGQVKHRCAGIGYALLSAGFAILVLSIQSITWV
jgi:hypothetical protein